MPKTPQPRTGLFYGMRCHALTYEDGSWLEPEEFCYPNGNMTRRAYALNTLTGRFNLVWCGIPDTYFSIPCRSGGYLTSDETGLKYHPKPRKL